MLAACIKICKQIALQSMNQQCFPPLVNLSIFENDLVNLLWVANVSYRVTLTVIYVSHVIYSLSYVGINAFAY